MRVQPAAFAHELSSSAAGPPDTRVTVRKVFGIDLDMEAPACSYPTSTFPTSTSTICSIATPRS